MSATHISGPFIVDGGIVAGFTPKAGSKVLFAVASGPDLDGSSPDTAYSSVQDAIDNAAAGDTIIMYGSFTEDVLITGDKRGLTLIGGGARRAASISAESTNGIALEIRADNVTLINIGVATNGTGIALKQFGSRLRAYGCKFEADDTGTCVRVLPGTVIQHAASGSSYYGNGADNLFDDCEFCWAVQGVESASSDYGACTELRIRNSWFHDLSTCHIRSNDIQGSAVCTRALTVSNCTFSKSEEAALPTDYVRVDAVGDTGTFDGNRFANPTNEAAVLTIVAGVMWMANATEAGWSTARPA